MNKKTTAFAPGSAGRQMPHQSAQRGPLFPGAIGATQPLTEEEEAELDGAAGGISAHVPEHAPAEAEDEESQLIEPESDVAHGPPDWAVLPEDFKIPAGKRITYLRFPAELTDYPEKGDRQCVIWNLTYADEKAALKRCHGEALRTLPELVRASIRAHDGEKTNWADTRSFERWWNEIGMKCRTLLQEIYVRSHGTSQEERADFFARCVVQATSR